MSAAAATQVGVVPRILCVDDEPLILEAIARNLRRNHEVLTASSGAEGLAILEKDPTISVVISDMRMPAMTGAVFLARARVVAPDAIRMLLTGQADLDSAIAAVNDGGLFRFLTKPCPLATLRDAMAAALEQHRLVTSERVLLEQTLRGAVKALVDVLALVSPAAFGRANRIKHRAATLAHALGINEVWQIEVAALLCQLGLVGLSDELCERVQRGASLDEDEQRMVARVPAITESLLANIPRIETVREIVALHVRPPAATGGERRLGELGAHVLRVALDADILEPQHGTLPTIDLLRARGYDREVVDALARLGHTLAVVPGTRELGIPALRVGMVLADDVLMANGTLLVTRGYEITPGFLERVRNFPPGTVRTPVKIVD